MMTTKTADALASSDGSSMTSNHRGRLASFLLGAPKFHLVLIAVLLVTTLGFAMWRSISIYRLEGKIATNKQQTRDAMVAQSGELLQLTAIPLAWAIRGEVLTNNTSNIDAYMDKLVQQKYVKRIVFVDGAGRIVASTNVKLKDQPAATALPGVDIVATRPRVDRSGAELQIVVPVMSFERQIGTLVLDYSSGQAIDAKLAE